MNVKNVVIINDFNYIQGGASKVAIDTAVLLKEDVKIFFFSAVNLENENIEGITYISTNQNEALKEKNRFKGFINGIYNFKAKRKLKKLLLTLDRKETIIHVHGWTKALSSSVIDIALKMKFKVVLTLHDYFSACPNGGYFDYKKNVICKRKPLSLECITCNCDSRNFFFKVYRIIRQVVQNKIVRLNKRLKYVIGLSDLSIKILKETLNNNIYIEKIYNPMNFNEKNEINDFYKNEYFLYVGRVSKEKGVEVFCNSVTEVGLKGIVVGDGSEKNRLEKIYPNIEFTGWKNKDEVEFYMKNAKCLIFPSLWYETFGLTIIEALKLGIPCVVNNVCAGKEFIKNHENGFIYKTEDELKQIIRDFDITFKGHCLDVELFDYKNKLLDLYKKILTLNE